MSLDEFGLIERIRRRTGARADIVLGIGDDAALFKILRGQHGIGAAVGLRLDRGQAAVKGDRVQQDRGVLRQKGRGQKGGGQKQRDAHRYLFPCGRDHWGPGEQKPAQAQARLVTAAGRAASVMRPAPRKG